MARISENRFHDLTNEVPSYLDGLKKYICDYGDAFKRFMMRTIAQIPYFHPEDMTAELFHQVLYGFEEHFYVHDSSILKDQDACDTIYIVGSGCLELFTELEGNVFVIERLYQGSILNSRVIFTDDQMHLSVKTVGHTLLHQITLQ